MCPASQTRSPTYRASRFFARFWGLMAFLASLPAPGGRTEGRGGTDAKAPRTTHHPKGPSTVGEGLLYVRHDEGPPMTMKTDPAKPPGAPTSRRSHVPADGSVHAAAIERARKGMLHEARDLKRTRIGADVLCEALLRQGVDVFFSYPGGVILPLYDVLGDYPELRHILVRHEQGGDLDDDAYALVTGSRGDSMIRSHPSRLT